MNMKSNIKGRIFTTYQAAEFLGLSISYLYKLTYRRVLPYYKPNGKKIYFLEADLKLWLTSKRIASTLELDNDMNRCDTMNKL